MVYLVVFTLVWAESAIFAGFLIPGESGLIVGGVLAGLGRVDVVALARLRGRRCGDRRLGGVRGGAALRATAAQHSSGSARQGGALEPGRAVHGPLRWPFGVPRPLDQFRPGPGPGAGRGDPDAVSDVSAVERARRADLGGHRDRRRVLRRRLLAPRREDPRSGRAAGRRDRPRGGHRGCRGAMGGPPPPTR